MPKRRTSRVTIGPADNLDAALATKKPLQLREGVYALGRDIPDGADLKGAGMGATHVKGRVTFGSESHFAQLKMGDAGASIRNRNGARNTIFDHVQFRGGAGSGGDSFNLLLGDWSRSCSGLLFVDCRVECNLGDGNNVRITEHATQADGAHIEDVTFRRCHFGVSNGVRQGCPRMDFEAYCAQLSGGTTFYHGWKDLKIIDCVFEPSDWYNIDLACGIGGVPGVTADGAIVRGCTLKGGKNYTICVESPTGVVIENNTIWRGANNTFKMGWGDMSAIDPGTIVRGNTFDLDAANGLSTGSPALYVKGGGNVIENNVIRAHGFSGTLIQLEQAHDNRITGNTISTSTSRVIAGDYAGSGNVLSPNTVTS